MNKTLIAAMTLVLLTITACGAGELQSNPTPTAIPTLVPPTKPPSPTAPPTATLVPTATPVPTSANPQDALARVFRSWLSAKSFRAKVVVTPAPAKPGTPVAPTEMLMDVVMPDRFHVTSNQIDAIKIGADFYLKTSNQWKKLTLPAGLDFSFADVKKLETELGNSTEIKLIGPDVLNGTPALVYQYTTTIKTPTATTATTKVWIAVVDGLPRQVESIAKSGAKTVITYSDFNANIAIDPPIK